MESGERTPERLEVDLLATAGLVRRAYDARFAPLGLNITESGLLQLLHHGEPHTQSQLADRLHIGRMSAGTVVKGLVRRGLVERDRDPLDGRAWSIRLTETGTTVAATCIDIDREVTRQLRADLSRDDQRVLRQLLANLRRTATGVMGSGEAEGSVR